VNPKRSHFGSDYLLTPRLDAVAASNNLDFAGPETLQYRPDLDRRSKVFVPIGKTVMSIEQCPLALVAVSQLWMSVVVRQ
jgi:hypothetical protein